jgi:hypothetical protein
MFKKLLGWLSPEPQAIPENARYVVVSGGNRGLNQQWVLVVPPTTPNVTIESIQHWNEVSDDWRRPSRVIGRSSINEEERARRNAAWRLNHLPDECLFR